METALQNCRFPSLVVVERALKKKTVFTRTFFEKFARTFPSHLWHKSGTQWQLLRKTYSDELFILGGFFGCVPPQDKRSETIAGVLRGKTIRGNTTRNSERKMALREGLWEGLWKISENLWKPLRTSENLWNPPSQRSSPEPSQWQISLSEPLRPVAPNRVAP